MKGNKVEMSRESEVIFYRFLIVKKYLCRDLKEGRSKLYRYVGEEFFRQRKYLG